ncbi:MAG: DNA polymerase III subunit gamma/tau [Proteobacteria bacterium]|nr:DNA polymerase III subunit gamma/tau [Pseudomonadota bacterium]
MSYQVLARKWRPKSFAELVGQEHVVAALTNALTTGRLHHAYLLTGTRGVGKTTIARILAKSLNCELGVTPTPCGVCAACTAIDAGRFVDLLELDAASNTGVDNMREILDNARYAPTVGRYKVYLIDEVHMLSKGAFNSMLKTLEEPPEHVKFVLATTDPQKIPVTVLSRCLQFNLKPLPVPTLTALLTRILTTEGIAHEAGGVALVARAAHGSARDALSLLDQGIAYAGGSVTEAAVRAMLGAVDRDYVYALADALVAGDGAALLAQGDALVQSGLAPASALEELAALWHRVAVLQAVPAAAETFEDAERCATYAAAVTPETVQLYYQIAVTGQQDLALAPDEATGFAMSLLRMLAFGPAAIGGVAGSEPPRVAMPKPAAAAAPRAASAAPVAPTTAKPVPSVERIVTPRAAAEPARATAAPTADALAAPTADVPLRPLPDAADQWPSFVAGLPLTGMAAQLATQSEWRSLAGATLTLAVPVAHRHLADKAYADKLKAVLERATGRKLILAFEVGEATSGSLAARQQRERDDARAEDEARFRDQPFVRDTLARFDAKIRPDSIKRVD